LRKVILCCRAVYIQHWVRQTEKGIKKKVEIRQANDGYEIIQKFTKRTTDFLQMSVDYSQDKRGIGESFKEGKMNGVVRKREENKRERS
jgi:hypothetical protein